MFPTNLLRRLVRDDVATKGEVSRNARVRARRYPVGLEPLEGRQLLSITAYMQVGDGTVVNGGATGKDIPPGSFEVTSFNWSISSPITVGGIGMGGGQGPGIVSAPNFAITKIVDQASTALFAACTEGTVFATGELILLQTTKLAVQPLLEYNFVNLVMSSAQWSGSSGFAVPTESDTFAFNRVTISYWNASNVESSASWDFSTASAEATTVSSFMGAVGTLNFEAKGLDKAAGVHSASHDKGAHKDRSAPVRHTLAPVKVFGTRESNRHLISDLEESLVRRK